MSSVCPWILLFALVPRPIETFRTLQRTRSSQIVKSLRSSRDGNAPRDVETLRDWGLERGVVFGRGVSLENDGQGDSGVHIMSKHVLCPGDVALHIPSSLILSSKQTGLNESQISLCRTSLGPRMVQYLPEFLVMVSLMEELCAGSESPLLPWLQSLPQSFCTGLWADDKQRVLLKRLAPRFMEHQEEQWEAFLYTVRVLQVDISPEALRWAFTVVFTRSWRTPSGGEAVIVPVGDMVNHRSSKANVVVSMDDNGCDMMLKHPSPDGELLLDYGISQLPERFLVIYGFCDTSSTVVYLDIPFQDERVASELGFRDFSKVTVNFGSLEVSKNAWDAVLYKVLLQNSVEEAQQLRRSLLSVSREDNNNPLLIDLHAKWSEEKRQWLASYAKDKAELCSSCLVWNGDDHANNLQPIVKYCKTQRDWWGMLYSRLR